MPERVGVIALEESRRSTVPVDKSAANPAVTLFLCSNCARPGLAPTSAGRPRPSVPDFALPWPVRQVLLPCTGRLQPEMVLKAFESGARLVCAIACAGDNCHYLEGSKRCARRVGYLRSMLDEIGLGGERLLLFSLPGTAAEDMALAAGAPAETVDSDDLDAQVIAIRDEVIRVFRGLPPSPLDVFPVTEAALESYQEVDTTDDDS